MLYYSNNTIIRFKILMSFLNIFKRSKPLNIELYLTTRTGDTMFFLPIGWCRFIHENISANRMRWPQPKASGIHTPDICLYRGVLRTSYRNAPTCRKVVGGSRFESRSGTFGGSLQSLQCAKLLNQNGELHCIIMQSLCGFTSIEITKN
jgi:hypothetical protein